MSADYWEISRLISRYAELLNLGQLDEVGELFRYGRITSPDGSFSVEGPEAVTGMYKGSLVMGEKLPDTLIITSNLQIDVEGDAATSKAYFTAMHQMKGAIVPVIAGRYHDKFRRVDGTWWFEERCMFTDLIGDLSTHLNHEIDHEQH
ncbi:MAG TPA: nuclear transport factor 2 family protein [Acidimicrobiales bacterium]